MQSFDQFGAPSAPPASSDPMPAPRPPTPIANLAEALSEAQAMLVPPVKNRSVDFVDKNGARVKYNYADLADVIESYREPLSSNGLALIHQLEYSGGRFGMITRLMHVTGEEVSTWYPLPDPARNEVKAQAFGAALTYARRYSVSALLGIASEEDDDGEKAADAKPARPPGNPANSPVKPKGNAQETKSPASSGASKPPVTPAAPDPSSPPPAGNVGAPTQPMLARLFAIAGERGWNKEQVRLYMIAAWNVESSRDLNRDQYDYLIAAMEAGDFSAASAKLVTRNVSGGSS